MIKSMTGYGSASGTSGKLEITVELRSVNNRFLDCTVKLPRVYTVLEDGIKTRVQSVISRGKVDVFITIDASKADNVTISVNESLADAYVSAIKQLSERYCLPNDVTAVSLSRMQDVLYVTKTETDVEQLGKDIDEILSRALADFDSMRVREGEKLYNDICSRADAIERLVAQAEERSPITVAEYRERLTKRLKEVLENTKLDEARILTEAAIFADRVAVNEETVRLHSHIAQLRQLLNSDVPVGRKLDFLVQEFNREANTLGSKGNDLEMARIVVDLKAEIEKVREQIQNVE
ncbi:MAG: YicC/YloC family endoribonuclease [Oscillospiraceae bacterium]